jgi:hypothetical protein
MIILPLLTRGQDNLVPNGSFEEYTACPNTISQIHLVISWINPTAASPDYYNACGSGSSVPQNGTGFQEAHSGNAYVGGFTYGGHIEHNLREYIQAELNEPITREVPYIVSFWVSLGDQFRFSVNTLGAYFSQEQIFRNDLSRFEYVPQVLNTSDNPLTDKVNWMLVTDTFISSAGGEKFITIGNFNDDSESDTMTISTEDGQLYKSYYLIDDVSVVALDTHVGVIENEEIKISVFPNPASNHLIIEYLGDPAIFELYDISGRSIKKVTITEGKQTIDIEDLVSGIYNYVVRGDGNTKHRGKQIITK